MPPLGERPAFRPEPAIPKRATIRRAGAEPPAMEKPWLTTFKKEDWDGKSYEDFVFGKAPRKNTYHRSMEAFLEKKGSRQAPEREFLDIAREHYGGDPLAPPTDFARALRQRVAELGGLKGEKADLVAFYSSVDDPDIDYRLGIDAWIELSAPRGKRLIVTLDATTNPEKEPKAHIKVDRAPAFRTDPFFREAVDHYAAKAWERLESEMKVNRIDKDSL